MWVCIPGILVRASGNPKRVKPSLVMKQRDILVHLSLYGVRQILDAIEDLATGVPVSFSHLKEWVLEHECRRALAGVRPFIDDMDVDGLLPALLNSATMPEQTLAINVDEARL